MRAKRRSEASQLRSIDQFARLLCRSVARCFATPYLQETLESSGVSVNERVAELRDCGATSNEQRSNVASEQKIEMICVVCAGW